MKKIFLDMDGTIAKFNSKKNALDRFKTEKGFFASLKPFANINSINEIIKGGNAEIFIISASPNEQADNDKMLWLNKYLPQLKKENICFCRLGENKAEIIKNKLGIEIDSSCYLLDDYTKNLVEWCGNGGTGIKRLTSLADNRTKKWKGLTLKNLKNLLTIIA